MDDAQLADELTLLNTGGCSTSVLNWLSQLSCIDVLCNLWCSFWYTERNKTVTTKQLALFLHVTVLPISR
jgi:hypothetical protein